MSVFLSILCEDQLTMFSDSQGTNAETGAVIHDQTKIIQVSPTVIVSIGGDADEGMLCLNAAQEELGQDCDVMHWTESLRDLCVTAEQALVSKSIRDRVILLQVGGTSSDNALLLFQILATPECVRVWQVHMDSDFPVCILPPKDLSHADCLSIVKSTAHLLYPHISHLRHSILEEIADWSIEEISRRSQYVDNIPQHLTIKL